MSLRSALRILALSLATSAAASCAAPNAPPPAVSLPPATSATPATSAASTATANPAAGGASANSAAGPSEEDAAVPISPRNPTWGSRLAPVTIVEFADLQCPFSRRAQDTLAELREKYGPEKLRIAWKNNPLPFHKNARPAAEAAMGVFALSGRDAFWKFHDLAFQNQVSLERDAFVKWAQQAGVADTAAFVAGLDAHQWAFSIDDDKRQAAALGATGTPAFFINGVFVNGAQPLPSFTKVIDAQLAKAQAEIAAGTAPERVYAKLAAENRTAEAAADRAHAGSEENDRIVYKVPLGKSPVLGPATAPVTIVELADFQCPFSLRVQQTLRALRSKYADKLRIVWRNDPLPFHKAAEGAAEAALEVRAEKGDAAFWDMHDRLFAAQKDLLLNDGPNAEVIADLGSAAGADRARVRKAVVDRTHKKEIDADLDLVEDFKANGTPHFFINGRRLVGAQPQEKFEKIIDEEIGKAQALVAKGVKPADVYAALTKDGAAAVEPETKDVPAGLPSGDPSLGEPNAKVTLHEWADFQCPFSARAEATLQQIVKDYGKRIKIVWHDLPLTFHPEARSAARAAREAFAQKGAAGFWAMHDKLFANQLQLKRADLDGYAAAMNLDATRWAAALDGDGHAREVEADEKAANLIGITGTPGFLIVPGSASRGYSLSGAQSYHAFRRLIDRAFAQAPGAPAPGAQAAAAPAPSP
jgi:protein-disulfide isomerase